MMQLHDADPQTACVMRSVRTDVDATGAAAIGMAETTGVAMATARSIGAECTRKETSRLGTKSKNRPAVATDLRRPSVNTWITRNPA